MKKIYMVIADNGEPWPEDHKRWDIAAFTSERAAQAYIDNLTEEIHAAEARVEELEKLFDERGTTPEEEEEYAKVNDLACDYWHFFDHGGFSIKEFELHE